MNIDFICVGFAKCGTTTIDTIMRRNPKIQLPIVKETYFLSEKNIQRDIHKLESIFFKSKKGSKKRGIIEPSVCMISPRFVKKILGKDIKIFFLIRDPVKREYSNRKMWHRSGDPIICKYSGKKRKFNEQFSDFIKTDFIPDNQSQIISSYLKVFGEKNVKIFLFEDFISDPKKVVTDIYQFIDAEYDINQSFESWENKGAKISKNLFCGKINHLLFEISFRKRLFLVEHGLFNYFLKVQKIIEKFTLISDDSKIKKKDFMYLQKLFLKDVLALENITGMPLRKKWKWKELFH